MSAMRRAAQSVTMLAILVAFFAGRPAGAQVVLPDFHTLVKTVEGPQLEGLQKQAELAAIHSCIGRLYFSEKLIMAEELLQRYIENNYQEFISEAYLKESQSFKDLARQTWSIVVRFSRLKEAMEELRFLYEPRYRPYHAVMFQERRDGRPTLDDEARLSVIRIFNSFGLRVKDQPFQELAPPQSDVFEMPEYQQREIRIEAMRNDIELLVTGHINILDRGTKSIYLIDNFFYNEIEMELHVIRVDNGQVLYSLKDRFKYTDRSLQALRQRSVKEITAKLATAAAERFNPAWRLTILDKADYQIMVTSVNRNDAEIMKNMILSLPGSEVATLIGDETEIVMPQVFERNFYADVGVYSVLYKGPRENLIELLTSMQHPRLVVVDEKEKQIWVDQVK